MRNVAPSRSLVRRANQFRAIAFLLAALGVFVLAVGIVMVYIQLAAPNTSSYSLYLLTRSFLQLLGIGMIVAAIALAIRAFTWKTDNDLAKIVGAQLGPILDDSYTLIRNVSKFSIGYVDAVLVGPPGVLVMRLIDNTGTYINEGANWMVFGRSETEILPARINPTNDTIADIARIRRYLERNGINGIPYYGIVVLMKEPPVTRMARLINPTMPVAHLSQLYTVLGQFYLTEVRIDRARADEIVRLLYGERLTLPTVNPNR